MPENATRRIRISAGSELARSLRDARASGTSLSIDTGDGEYPISVAPRTDVGSKVKPDENEIERSREGIRRAAGSWQDVDAEALKIYLAQRRRTANRPPVRW